MAHVISQPCCNDASCIPECPVDCIRPTPAQREFATTEMLYIDPATCIDCGACVEACPVDAIAYEDDLPALQTRFIDINAAYFERHPLDRTKSAARLQAPRRSLRTLRVAIVGAGPAACYAAENLLARANVEVEMFEKLPTPYGLVRAGVAPDHQGTKGVASRFESAFEREDLQFYLNTEVGRHISFDELREHHHAVVFAVGASNDQRLGIPGEDLPGSHAASDFVAWYNGHPERRQHTFDLSGTRAVVVGNGNVAIDVARMLTLTPEQLGATDIADHALEALRVSNIREVILLGRRGPAQAAYSTSEFMALGHLPNIDIVVDDREIVLDAASAAMVRSPEAESWLKLKVTLADEYSKRPLDPGHKRIVFRYLLSPVEILGADHVEGIRVAQNELVESTKGPVAKPTDRTEILKATMVLRSIGYRGEPIPGLPFDERNGIVPNETGRVAGDDGEPMRGVYVTGWIKRGPRGVIGSNKVDAQETVDHLLEDFESGRLEEPAGGRASLRALLTSRGSDVVGRDGWRAIDQLERERGAQLGRPRVKFTDVAEMVAVAKRS